MLLLDALLLAGVALPFFLPTAEAQVACNDTHIHDPCEELLWKGSHCRDGFCTNPFQAGCLRSMFESEEYEKKYGVIDDVDASFRALRRRLLSTPRVCNSEDGPEAVKQGLCVESEGDYPEVRIYSQNWESAFVMSWIMQLIYSELLGVPSSIESGEANKTVDFYDEFNRMDYGTANDPAVIQNAHNAEGGDCATYKKMENSGQGFFPCAHMTMEIWNPSLWQDVVNSGAAEAIELLGMFGTWGWRITNFSLKKDPSLANHYGLSGKENRKKLAETFKRPMKWANYCNLVSSTNCSVDDGVAKRPPADDGSEDNLYFLKGLYTGHFRDTEKNDCISNSTTCTGHILDCPCGWSSHVKQQAKHLEIALESDGSEVSGGYTYADMVAIWHAANATKSDVIGWWWEPDVTASLFVGSESELTQVLLPKVTQECLDNRIDIQKRCDPNATEFEIYGDSKGSCGELPSRLRKIAAKVVQTSIKQNNNLKSRMSPAYEVYQDFSMDEVQINEILEEWTFRKQEESSYDLRVSTCKWMANNLENVIKSFVPPSYPRTFVKSQNSALSICAILFSAIAILISLGTTGGILYKHRNGTVGRGAQIEFLLLLLAGLFMVSIGSLLLALEPSTGTCTGSVWMVNVGYTTQLVPTIIRVSTIIKIVRSSLKMKIVKVDKKKLLQKSIGISGIAALFCTLWTILDKPHSQASLKVTDEKNDLGETVVLVSYFCGSTSRIWFYVSFTCQALLLLSASVLASQMRQVPNAVNDSKLLAIMIYSSFFFLALRVAMYLVEGAVSDDTQSIQASLQKARSMFCSVDTVLNIIIFFTRFFIADGTKKTRKMQPQNARHFENKIAQRDNNATDVTYSHQSTATAEETRLAPDLSESNPETEKMVVEADTEKEVVVEGKEEETKGSSFVSVRFTLDEKSATLPRWVMEQILEEYGDVSFENEIAEHDRIATATLQPTKTRIGPARLWKSTGQV
eukprot:CAMPEP_0183713740 /NCGR_PEP_ID=MMETSP0737-20130205/8494_1 /TAXON_ID=385413 /ORGANISM="Thalassiosira miniscula, Strain CCMP1093" /LENGTH=971 /DNA_ID=CAMNT_0025942567 /DNA_START=126 /DNA_END=3041 /DNA_ORIENTATION=+